ncbi:MAG: S-layer homology domain-containing protein [Halanaerobiales bacterium]
MKKYSAIITILLVLTMTVSTFAGSFADVPNNHWAYEAVNKLVASGLVQGYPDGTFKGQNDLSRYEIAVMIARLLEDVEEARRELVDQADFMVNDALIEANSGLSEAEAEEVKAILETVIEQNQAEASEEASEPQKLSAGQAGEVMTIVGDLASEFNAELETMGVKVASLEDRVEDLETITFNGEYKAEFKHVESDNDAYDNPFNAGDAIDTDEDTFNHSVDLNVAIDKAPLSADLDLEATTEGLGIDDHDSNGFNLESISAVITGPEFVATIKEGQEEKVRDYLFDAHMDDDDLINGTNGIKLETMGETYLLTGFELGEDDEDNMSANDHYAFAGTNKLETLADINFVYGFEVGTDELIKANNNVFGLYRTFDFAGFDVTPELAISNTDLEELYFTLNAEGNVGNIDTTFNFKNIEEAFEPVYADVDAAEGYDIKGEKNVGIVDLVAFHEDYGNPFTYVEGEVTEANGIEVVGFNVFGNAAFRTYSDATNATSELVTVQAKNSYGKLDVLGKVEHQETTNQFDVEDGDIGKDDDTYETEEDKLDTSIDLDYAFSNSLKAGAFYKWNQDMNMSEHVYNVDYARGIVTAGAEMKIEADENHVYAGLNADKAESYDILAMNVTPYAQYKFWDKDVNTTNLLAGVETSKAVNEYATLTAAYEYASYEEDDDFGDDTFNAGTLLTTKLGASYKITEDVSANADYRNLNFDGDTAQDYQADEVTAGVSVSF